MTNLSRHNIPSLHLFTSVGHGRLNLVELLKCRRVNTRCRPCSMESKSQVCVTG